MITITIEAEQYSTQIYKEDASLAVDAKRNTENWKFRRF